MDTAEKLLKQAPPELKKLHFTYLPAYARFLLDTKLEAYVAAAIALSRAVNLPVLKHFEFMGYEKLL